MKKAVVDSFTHLAELKPQLSQQTMDLIYTSTPNGAHIWHEGLPITIWDEIPRAVWPMPQVIGEAEMSVRRQVAENMGMEFVEPSATALEEYARRDAWYSQDYSWLEERALAHYARGFSKEKMKRDAIAYAYGMSPEKIKEQGVSHVGIVRNHGRSEFGGTITGRFSSGQPEPMRGPSPRKDNPPG